MGKSLREMTAEVREVNTALGWRNVRNPWPEYVALLHTELSEALEAYRDHRLADATKPIRQQVWPNGQARLAKPEGVGSEFADVLIRLLDMSDVHGLTPFEMDLEIGDVVQRPMPEWADTFPSAVAWLHVLAARLTDSDRLFAGDLPGFLWGLVTVADVYNIDLATEFDRKLAYNRTRPYQHGGRTIRDEEAAV